MKLRQAVQSQPLGHSQTWFSHTALPLLDVPCMRCTNVHSTCHSTQSTQAVQFCPRSASPNYGFRPAPRRTKQVHSSSLYTKTTKLTKLCPTAKWAVVRSVGRSAVKWVETSGSVGTPENVVFWRLDRPGNTNSCYSVRSNRDTSDVGETAGSLALAIRVVRAAYLTV